MKIIDVKGRLFGKINLIDFFALLFFLSMTPMFYFVHKVFFKKTYIPEIASSIKTTQEIKKEAPKIEYKIAKILLPIMLEGIDDSVFKNIKVGDRMHNEKGDVIAEIVNIDEIQNDTGEIDMGDGTFVQLEENSDSDKKRMLVKMRLKGKIDNKQFFFNEKRIVYNSPIELNLNNHKITGRVAKVGMEVLKSRLPKSLEFDNQMFYQKDKYRKIFNGH